MKNFGWLLKFPVNALIIIVTAAFVIRVYNLNFNSIFVDEAFYIIIGQKILEGRITETIGDISWLGGFPFFYPLVSGVSYLVGGILGTRFTNVLLGVASVVLIYTFTEMLNLFKSRKNNQIAGLVAASFMTATAIPIEAARLAIYDGLSFTMFLLGLNLFLKAVDTRKNYFYLLCAVILFLSFLAKYITIIFFPFLILAALYLANKNRGYVINFFCIPLLGLVAFYIFSNLESLTEYFSSQVADPSTTYFDVLSTFWEYSWVAYGLSITGIAILWKSKKWVALSLIFMSMVPVLIHTISRNDTSAHQHTFLSLIFIFPLIGAIFVFLYRRFSKTLVGIGSIILFAIYLSYSLAQVADLETFWPNSSEAISILKVKVKPGDYILAEGSDTIALGLGRKIQSQNIVGPFVFDYKGEEGDSAYIKAIDDGYFRFIELENVYFSSETSQLIQEKLPEKYLEIFDDGKIQVFERKL